MISRWRLPPVTCPSKVKGRATCWQWRWRKPRGVWGREWIQPEFEACGGRKNPTGCHRALRPPAVWVVREDRPRCLGLHIPVVGRGRCDGWEGSSCYCKSLSLRTRCSVIQQAALHFHVFTSGKCSRRAQRRGSEGVWFKSSAHFGPHSLFLTHTHTHRDTAGVMTRGCSRRALPFSRRPNLWSPWQQLPALIPADSGPSEKHTTLQQQDGAEELELMR